MKLRRLLIYCCLTAVAFVLLVVAGMYHVAAWLQSGELPSKADAIVALAGEPLRAFYAADLYNEGYARVVYVSQPTQEPWMGRATELGITVTPQEEIYRSILVKKGVPKNRVLFFGKSLSTAQEAEQIRPLFQHQGCTLLVVTSPYHVRRTQLIFRDTVPLCRTTVVSTPYESFPIKWWRDQYAARNVLLEFAKIVYYKMGGKFRGPMEEQQHAD
jgi:uncharacterized SAM-binding protein YcdF (DUF218 family)